MMTDDVNSPGKETCLIERFEAGEAVMETPTGFIRISRSLLPHEAVEGDVMIRLPDGTWQIDTDETSVRRQRIQEKMNRLLEKSSSYGGAQYKKDERPGGEHDHRFSGKDKGSGSLK